VNDLCQVVWQEDVGDKDSELAALSGVASAIGQVPSNQAFHRDAAFARTRGRALVRPNATTFCSLRRRTRPMWPGPDSFRQLRAASPPLLRARKKRGLAGRNLTHALWVDTRVSGYGHGSKRASCRGCPGGLRADAAGTGGVGNRWWWKTIII